MSETVLRTESVTKVFAGTVALKDVDFRVFAGKVNALVGENGAGKSTLMKILAGAEQPTLGRILLGDVEVRFQSPRDAYRYGIGIIYQELSLFPNMSVTDNIFAGRELARWGTVARKDEEARARELLERLEVRLNPRTVVGDLRVAHQQVVEIAQALSRDVRILIMDEPTSALGVAEVKVLFRVIRELTAHGVSVIYISHKLDEVLEIADYVTVLRDGHLVAEARAADVGANWIIEQMIGRELGSLFPKESYPAGEELLRVDGLTVRDPTVPGGVLFESITFTLHKGEILGIYGLRGAGRTELLECLIGRVRATGGDVWLSGRHLSESTIGSRIGDGLALVPEDRQRDGLVPTTSVAKNMTLASLGRLVRFFSLSGRAETDLVDEMTRRLSIRTTGPDQPVTDLSGGNQQKVIVGRALLTSPKVLLLDEPTRGIDVGAKAEIFEIMNGLARDGYGIVFVSSELDELLAMSDRIVVMSRGRTTGEFAREHATEDRLVRAAAVNEDAMTEVQLSGNEGSVGG